MRRWDWETIALLLALKAILLFFAVQTFAVRLQSYGGVLEVWRQWDAVHYIHLAEHGYSASGKDQLLLAFFPLLTSAAAIMVQTRTEFVASTLQTFLSQIVPPGTEDLVVRQFRVMGVRPPAILIGAALVSLWAASGFIKSLIEGMQAAYRVPRNRGFVRQSVVEAFNTYLTKRKGPASPTELALEFVRSDRTQAARSSTNAQSSPEGGGPTRVTVVQEGLADDSVRAIQDVLNFVPSGDKWRLESAVRKQRCQPGRGHQDFAASDCV